MVCNNVMQYTVHDCALAFPPDLREGSGHRTKRNDRQYQESIVTGQDIRNIKRKVDDDMVMKHDNDATSVSLTVSELQQESFNPVLLFKASGGNIARVCHSF